MPTPPHNRRASRAAVAALGAAGLIAMASAPAAFGDEAAPELVVGGIEPISGVHPGSSFGLPVTVANKGAGTADKVWVSYAVTRGLDFTEIPSNCLSQQVWSYDEMPERWFAVCAFDQAVEPGVVYTPEKPLRIKARDRALNDQLRVQVGDVDPGADENGTAPVAGTAPAVRLVEAQPGDEASADLVEVPVTSVNTADYQVTGAALKGSVGDTVPMKVKFTNAGPAWVRIKEGGRLLRIMVTPPAGTSVVKAQGSCKAEGATYACGTGQQSVNEGGRETYAFELKIDKRVAGAKGSVTLSTEARPFDPDKSNDKADITLDVTGGGKDGSPGGSANGSDGGSSSSGDAGTTTNSGSLANTGSSTPPVLGAAAAVVATGAGTLLVVRRRRAQSLN
ncbi:LPXTG cell wall anchor domain-containing protein [Streptomyces sp. NPDC006289]|uniref:LPXTG cell wall anchor domain-containing protein n=1 Tax=Streptomyces sp. NPDC006289 TaxID=3156744 RepID=UPI00339DD06A